MFVDSPNRFGLPPFYMLHAWLWKYQPARAVQPLQPHASTARDLSP